MTELLGGSVAVSSVENEGACFATWIPLRSGATSSAEERGPAAALLARSADDRTERVALMVEDDDAAAELLRILLEAEGFAVLRASSAEEALEQVPLQPLGLITVDIQLPGIDGWELIAALRRGVVPVDVPIVIVSSTSRGELVALNAGAAAIVRKPVVRSELTTALTSLGFHELHGRTRTVLVVDDDPLAVELVATYLPSPAYATVRAYGGQEGIVLAKQVRPDLIVLDLMMPDVDGFDVVQALKSDLGTASIPVLIVSSKDVTAEQRRVLNADQSSVVHVLEKAGFNRADFTAELRRSLMPR